MKHFYTFYALIIVLIFECTAIEYFSLKNSDETDLSRSGRTYDKPFKTEKSGCNHKGNRDQIDAYPVNPKNDQQSQGYSAFKLYNYPQFGSNGMEYAAYQPSLKGGFEFPSGSEHGDISQWSPFLTSNLKDTKEEKGGYLSKYASGKPTTASAMIPLSIIMAAVVPVLMNYMMTGLTPQVPAVQITATNKKESRSVDGSLDAVMERIAEFTRGMDFKERLQNYICEANTEESQITVPENMKRLTSTFARIVGDQWINNNGMKHFFDCVQKGNCDNLCTTVKTFARNNRK